MPSSVSGWPLCLPKVARGLFCPARAIAESSAPEGGFHYQPPKAWNESRMRMITERCVPFQRSCEATRDRIQTTPRRDLSWGLSDPRSVFQKRGEIPPWPKWTLTSGTERRVEGKRVPGEAKPAGWRTLAAEAEVPRAERAGPASRAPRWGWKPGWDGGMQLPANDCPHLWEARLKWPSSISI